MPGVRRTREGPPPELDHDEDQDYETTADLAPPAEVLQYPDRDPAVPIVAHEPIRVDLMPRRLGDMRTELLVDGQPARKILGRDPRRTRVILWCPETATDRGAFVAMSEGAANAESAGAGIIIDGRTVPFRVEIETSDELWARTTELATLNTRLCLITEHWTR